MSDDLEMVDHWVDELLAEAANAEWAFAFRFGYQQGLVAIRIKIDGYRKANGLTRASAGAAEK